MHPQQLNRLEIVSLHRWIHYRQNTSRYGSNFPLVGWNWLQSCHAQGLACHWKIESLPSLRSLTPYTLPTIPPDHHISSNVPDGWHQALLQHLFMCSAPHNFSSLWYKHQQLKTLIQCLCCFGHLNLWLSLATLRYGLFFEALHWQRTFQSPFFTVEDDIGVLQVLFNTTANCFWN